MPVFSPVLLQPLLFQPFCLSIFRLQQNRKRKSPRQWKYPQSLPLPKPASITYTAAGDIILHKPFLESPVYLDSQDGTYDYTSIFTYCKDLLSEADYTSVTFEGSLVDGSNGYSGYPMFQGPDALADALAASGIDMVNLASNHVYDAAEEGFLRTLDVIKQKNLIPRCPVFRRGKQIYYSGYRRDQSRHHQLCI